MTRVAAIDCGTNSIRLLIADVEADGSMHEIDRRMTIVRLGEGVDLLLGDLVPLADAELLADLGERVWRHAPQSEP